MVIVTPTGVVNMASDPVGCRIHGVACFGLTCKEDTMFFRSGFNYDRDAASEASGLKCLDKSLTVQAEKDDADINVIMKRFGITGALPVHQRVPLAEGFYEGFDYQESLNIVRAGQAAFNAQPAEVRDKFKNDPALFLEFFTDPKNSEEAVKLGLATAKKVEEPAAPIVDKK